MSFLSCKSVAKWYGPVIALNDLSFESDVPILGLLGPNGAGKSSLLKLFAGLAKPCHGKVEVFGQNPWNNPSLAAILGYCPEHHELYPGLSPKSFVSTLLRLNRLSAAEASRAAEHALDRLGLGDEKDLPVASLSQGMRQRLKLAQAVAHDPKCLILDEPLSGIDPCGRGLVMDMLKSLAENGVKIVVSSHVLHELESITSDILLLHRGKVLAQGNISDVRAMLDEHPHRIMLKTPHARRLGRKLADLEHVRRLEFEPGYVVVDTDCPDEFYGFVGETAASGTCRIDAMVPLDDDLQSVFDYLVK